MLDIKIQVSMDDFNFDAIVIGAGHAGVEAGLALSRLKVKTLVLTISLDNVGYLACNPSIGGTAKGHLVREIDALGGAMGAIADKTLIQLRMLNLSKGFSVQSLRAQVDKNAYHAAAKAELENSEYLQLRQGEVVSVQAARNSKHTMTADKKDMPLYTVRTRHLSYTAKAVIFCCGVYLKSKVFTGDVVEDRGPSSFARSEELSGSLRDLGIPLRRFKTGTPARIKRDSVDLNALEIQRGEKLNYSFSDSSKKVNHDGAVCYLGYTNQTTHEIIKNNLGRTAKSNLEGEGARYCPSIEDKIERFSDKERHSFFLEPEGADTQEMYVQGLSTSLDAAVQLEVYRSLKGFEKAQIMRDAYAIEYDCIDPSVLTAALAHKTHKGLFFAGQINGTSGYEEAAAQGLVAGVNAALYLKEEAPTVLRRDNSYIGVMIDDLITKGTEEPYRMMTSRAEFRLHLRQDNADLRLCKIGRRIGLVSDKRWRLYNKKLKDIKRLKALLKEKVDLDRCGGLEQETAPPSSPQTLRRGEFDSVDLSNERLSVSMPLGTLIKRHDVDFDFIRGLDIVKGISTSALLDVFIALRYEGYLQREERARQEQARLEEMELPQDFDYTRISGLRLEAAEKLNKVKPRSVAQAGRISGVNPADIDILLVRLKAMI